jgi:starch synthase (maltosyl-transferring)
MDQRVTAEATASRSQAVGPPRVYYLNPLLAGPLADWAPCLDRARDLGFSHVLSAPLFAGPSLFLPTDFARPHPALQSSGDAAGALAAFAQACRSRDLVPLLDLLPTRLAAQGVAEAHNDIFYAPPSGSGLDPRALGPESDAAVLRGEADAEAVGAFWYAQAQSWRRAGIAGFRIALKGLPTHQARALIAALRKDKDALLLGWTPGLSREERAGLIGTGIDFVFASLPWWDFAADWFWNELEELHRIAPVIAPVEAPYEPRFAALVSDLALLPWAQRRSLRFASAVADGWMMPMGFEWGATQEMDARRDLPESPAADPALLAEIRTANDVRGSGIPRLISGPDAAPFAFLRSAKDPRYAETAILTLVNAELDRARPVALRPLLATIGGRFAAPGVALETQFTLDPGEVRTLALTATPGAKRVRPQLIQSALEAANSPRIGIEQIAPAVDDGRFAAKRVAGDIVTVEADIICDGHDQLGVALLWRAEEEADWHETRMHLVVNDRWEGTFPLDHVGRYVFAVEAWRDAFATFRDEITKKHAAGIDVQVELLEGVHLVRAAGPPLAALDAKLATSDTAEQIRLLLSTETAALMAQTDKRPRAVRSAPYPIDADRLEARFASWYEIFPRSMSDDAERHGTFTDVIRHLPRIRDMGFDVLYFPPIHPIGRSNRKGPNNTLTPAEGDPGSPYAIGSEAGGHDAVHPELGTLDDFLRMREAAEAHGLEVALDFAIQCSPDHPWLKQHKRWFAWRPDGSIRYAENPPKKYQDIVNVDFYAEGAIPELWVGLAEVVMFWAKQGVRIFRVDNPHTKSFAFWEWMIAEVRAAYPGTQFLAEAFTRPKIMNRLGKLGFTQSYTYFTWRNGKRELEEYLTALSAPPMSDFFRPNFFVNTPDINPVFLQTHGRPGHLTRAVLAATLSSLWGVYSGFELCDATPLPGREEYLDSEKYQVRAWDWQRPGNIVAEITQLNRIRRQNPALQSHLGLTFLPADNDQVLFYEKATPDRSNVVIVAVNLDPRDGKGPGATIELPLYKWGLPDQGRLSVVDLMRGDRFTWTGKWQRVGLDAAMPFAAWRVRPETV